MNSLVNYQPLQKNTITNVLSYENSARENLLSNLIQGESSAEVTYYGVYNNTNAIYNFSEIDLKIAYNLEDALTDYLISPEVSRRFLTYKIEDVVFSVLYTDPDSLEQHSVLDTDAAILYQRTPFNEAEIEDLLLITQGSVTTILGFTLYYILYIPEESTFDVNSIDPNNFSVQLVETNNQLHYYKYNTQLNAFQELMIDRETQLGSGRLDQYFEINVQATDSTAIANKIQNRRGIVATQDNNNQPILTDYADSDIVFDTGSLWFIKTIEIISDN